MTAAVTAVDTVVSIRAMISCTDRSVWSMRDRITCALTAGISAAPTGMSGIADSDLANVLDLVTGILSEHTKTSTLSSTLQTLNSTLSRALLLSFLKCSLTNQIIMPIL